MYLGLSTPWSGREPLMIRAGCRIRTQATNSDFSSARFIKPSSLMPDSRNLSLFCRTFRRPTSATLTSLPISAAEAPSKSRGDVRTNTGAAHGYPGLHTFLHHREAWKGAERAGVKEIWQRPAVPQHFIRTHPLEIRPGNIWVGGSRKGVLLRVTNELFALFEGWVLLLYRKNYFMSRCE